MGGISWYITAFLMGLAGSLHCLGMCGPIFAATSSFYDSPGAYLKPVLLHHLGKIIAYAGIGIIMGLIGQGVSLFLFQYKIMLISGIVLIIMALGGLIKWKIFTGFNTWISQKMALLLGKKSKGIFLLGLVNGLIPCGLVYAAAVGAAATQNIVSGALFMAFFGLGTAPALTAVGFSRWLMRIKKVKNLALWKQIPVLILGLWLFMKGLGLGIPYISPDFGSHEPKANCCERHVHQ